jgi:hypothetical protein
MSEVGRWVPFGTSRAKNIIELGQSIPSIAPNDLPKTMYRATNIAGSINPSEANKSVHRQKVGFIAELEHGTHFSGSDWREQALS